MRVLGGLLALTAVAHADPVVEVGAFGGARWFTTDNQLGNSPDAAQVPRDAGVVGVRVGWLALPRLAGSADTRLQLALEAEGSVLPVANAPIAGARGQLALRLAHWDEVPHLVIGGGMETVFSSVPLLEDDTDWVVYYGIGATVPLGRVLELRFDVRHGIMQGRADALSSTLELQGALQLALGGTRQRRPRVELVRVTAAPPPIVTEGPPVVAPVVLTVPTVPIAVPVDPDQDGDGDGIPDVSDRCDAEPEVFNGYQDADGCSDTVPEALAQALALIATVQFEHARARVTPDGGVLLRQLMAALEQSGDLRLVVVGHPARIDKDDTLAMKRAEAVKWYLVDLGASAADITTRSGGIARQAVTIELAIAP